MKTRKKTTLDSNSKPDEYFDLLKSAPASSGVMVQQKPMLFNMLCENKTPAEILRTHGNVSLHKIVETNVPTIGALARTNEEEVRRSICYLLADLSVFFGGDLSKDQVSMIADEIMNTLLCNIRFEGLLIVCQEIKKMNITYKLKPNMVIRALNEHFEEQVKVTVSMNLSRHISVQQSEREHVKMSHAEQEFLKNTQAHMIEQSHKNQKK